MADRLLDWAGRVDLRRLGAGVGVAIVAIGAVASIQVAQVHYDLGGAQVRGFYLDGEGNVVTAFSVALAAGAALLSFGLAATTTGRHPRRVLSAFGVVLALLALDDALQLHERLESWTGVDWQILYAPVALLGAGLIVVVWRELGGDRRAQALLALAVVAWAVSQVFELAQHASGELRYAWTLIPEEVLEMVGFALVAFALLTVLQDRARQRVQSVA